METNLQLSALAFALGIVALIWVLRRTMLRLGRLPLDPDKLSYRLRKLSALKLIDGITAREQFEKYRSAVKLQRGQPALNAAEQAMLAGITRWQESMQRRPF